MQHRWNEDLLSTSFELREEPVSVMRGYLSPLLDLIYDHDVVIPTQSHLTHHILKHALKSVKREVIYGAKVELRKHVWVVR